MPKTLDKSRVFSVFAFSSDNRGWGIGIRTPTNRVRVCRATVTQFPKICNSAIIYQSVLYVKDLF